MPLSDQSRKPLSAFTLVELIATVSILALLVTVSVVFIGGYVAEARRTADKQTLAVLNDAITRYKCQGGAANELTEGMSRNSLITRLQTTVNWGGLSQQFLRTGFTIPAGVTLEAKGDKKNYHLTRYGTYTEETGGTTLPLVTTISKNGLVAWYDFDNSNDSHNGNYHLTEVNNPTYTDGYGVANNTTNACWTQPTAFLEGTGDRTYVIRLRIYNPGISGPYIFNGQNVRTILRWYPTYFNFRLNTTTSYSANHTAGTDIWHHVICELEFSTSTLRVYVDGVLASENIIGVGPISGYYVIGGTNTTTVQNCHVANLSFWTRLLSTDEKMRLFNGGSDIHYSDL